MSMRRSFVKLSPANRKRVSPDASMAWAARSALEVLENRVMLSSVNHSPDFSGDISDLTLNPGPPTAVPNITAATASPPNALQMTSGANGQTSSAWENTPQGVDTFDTTFDFTYGTVTPAGADGFTFTVQNAPSTTFAIGGGGGNLGYQGITNSVGVKFDIYPNVSTTGVYLNGAGPADTPVQDPSTTAIGPGIAVDLTHKPDGTASGIDFHANPGHHFRAHLVYASNVLTETVTDVTSGASVTQTYNVSVPGAVGDHTAYAGFTAATGGVNSEQDILNWTYTGTASTGGVVLPTPTLVGHECLPGQANLTWNSVSNSNTGYEIDQSTNNGATYTVLTTPLPTDTMYMAMGLDTTKTYLFKIKATGDGTTFLDSNFSNTVLIHGAGLQATPIVHNPDFSGSTDLTLNGAANGAHYTGAGIVGTVADPTTAPTLGQAAGTGLDPGSYFVVYSWNSAAVYPWNTGLAGETHGITASSPEASITLTTGNGILQVTPPTAPTNGGTANVYIGTTTGMETLAGTIAGGQTLSITALPATGAAAAPTTNSTFNTPANALALTASANNQDGSAFATGAQRVDTFDTTFTFTFRADNPGTTADGFTFAIQDNAPTTGGGGGGGQGYSGIGHSVAVKFDLYNGTGGAPTTQNSTTGVYTNGALNDNIDTNPGDLNTGYDLAASNIDFHANPSHVYQVHLVYNGTTLHYTLTDTNGGPTATFTMDFPIDIPTTIGDSCAYVGFTGATGGAHAEQDILSWTFPTASAPASQTINGTSGNDTITIKKDATDATKDDVWLNVPTTGAPTMQVSNAQTIVVNGAGGTDTLTLDSTNGNPIPTGGTAVLRLNSGTGSFTIGGSLPTLDATHVVDVGTSTVNIPYTGTSILPAVQSDLKNGFIKSTEAAGSSGKFAVADTDTGTQITLKYLVIGDLNGDGSVNFNDLLALAQHYGNTGADWAKGDLNYDGTVNFNDLLALAQHYGQTAAITAASLSSAASSSSLDLLASSRKAKTSVRKH